MFAIVTDKVTVYRTGKLDFHIYMDFTPKNILRFQLENI